MAFSHCHTKLIFLFSSSSSSQYSQKQQSAVASAQRSGGQQQQPTPNHQMPPPSLAEHVGTMILTSPDTPRELQRGVSGELFVRGQSCGGCFEVRCVDHILWCRLGSPSVVVTVTDFCAPNYGLPGDYGGWCNYPRSTLTCRYRHLQRSR
ncbi:expansin-A16-like [Iris pallida]|uniref:Expansin-A16-like n=1 Tax=Iris pallida TaxID=29817 RepID=A0AAX6E7F4_IRIPA|nr:expansin-A16-like [Iris pallida]